MLGKLCFALLPLAWGAPFLHTVNDKYINGSSCPAVMDIASCPVICTTDLTNCEGTSGSCPAGETLCLDGACYKEDSNCKDKEGADIGNVCDCGTYQFKRVHTQVPCKTVTGKFSNVNEDSGDAFCKAGLGGSPSTSLETTYPEGTEELSCEPLPVPATTATGYLILYFAWGGFALFNALWFLAKKSMESDLTTHDEKSKTHMTGYDNNAFGTLLFILYSLLTVSWFGITFWILAQYYLLGFDAFHGSYTATTKFFIYQWHSSSVWFVFSKFHAPNVRNYYRKRVSLDKCAYVAVWKADDPQILLEDDSKVTRFSRWMTNLFAKITGDPGNTSTMAVGKTASAGTRYFDFHCARYSWHTDEDSFKSELQPLTAVQADLLAMIGGLTDAQAAETHELAGQNFIRVDVPNVLRSIFNEICSYFYIYQWMVLEVFLYWDYWYMGIAHLSMVGVSGATKVYLKLASQRKIKSMAESKTNCEVRREGIWKKKSSLELVPGDVIKLEREMTVPADCAMISGNSILDEAMLTGEAMPVQKFSLSPSGQYDKNRGGKKNTLFAGTKVLDLQCAAGEDCAVALVMDVGAHTEKGLLVSDILYAPPATFVFDEHLKVVFCVLFVWGVVAVCVITSMGGTKGTTTWLYCIFIISQVLPPLLPAVLVIGQSASATRLRAANIFCVDLSRITMAGKVRVFCFDKTGTLTTEGLDFHGMLPTNGGKFGELVKDTLPIVLSQAIGCAHTVGKLGKNWVGNPVDVEMFKKSGWTFEANDTGNVYTKNGQKIKVLKQHEFDHGSMSMAAVVLIDGDVHVFIKGSFEAIQNLSNKASIPDNYLEQAQNLAANGCYTLGVAHKNLGPMDTQAAINMSRAECENGGDCVGLLMFRNNLKEDTTKAMSVLRKGATRPVMITGDTAMTGIYIARKCKMVDPKATLLLGELKVGVDVDDAKSSDIVWTNIDPATNEKANVVGLQQVLDSLNTGGELINITVSDDVKNDEEAIPMKSSRFELAMTGAVFRTLQKEPELLRSLLPCSRIFARMTPVGKVDCVQLHMEKFVTAMCGDGGNDCGALRAAHVGIAMSEGEASIVSPFSTSDKSVFAAVTVLREGRCCLATSFYLYDFILMYGATIVIAKLFYLYFNCQLAEMVWVFFEAFLVFSISITLAMAKPLDTLAPRRPTARLMGLEIIGQVFGIAVINFGFMIIAIAALFAQEFFACNEWDATKLDLSKWMLLGDNFEGETLGMLVMLQVTNTGAVGNFSAGYRQAWHKNWMFVLVFIASYVIVSYITLADPNRLGCWFRFQCGDPEALVKLGYFDHVDNITFSTGQDYLNINGHNVMPTEFRSVIWIIGLCNLAVVVFFVRFVVLGPVRTCIRNKWGKKRDMLY